MVEVLTVFACLLLVAFEKTVSVLANPTSQACPIASPDCDVFRTKAMQIHVEHATALQTATGPKRKDVMVSACREARVYEACTELYFGQCVPDSQKFGEMTKAQKLAILRTKAADTLETCKKLDAAVVAGTDLSLLPGLSVFSTD